MIAILSVKLCNFYDESREELVVLLYKCLTFDLCMPACIGLTLCSFLL